MESNRIFFRGSFPLTDHWIILPFRPKKSTLVEEKVRPRWWYIALASCSDHALQMSYLAASFTGKTFGKKHRPGVSAGFFFWGIFHSKGYREHMCLMCFSWGLVSCKCHDCERCDSATDLPESEMCPCWKFTQQ